MPSLQSLIISQNVTAQMRRPVIHIGANKTGSTTLQRSLFSKHSDIHYLGEDCAGYETYSALLNSMIADDDLFYPAEQCRQLFEKYMHASAGRTLLYSSEDLTTSSIPYTCARRLKNLMPDAKILLVVRSQLTAIPSFYTNHGAFLKPAPDRYYRRHVSFDDWMSYQLTVTKYGALTSYYYDKVLSIYSDLFGIENIYVLLFEEFVNDKKVFLEKLCRILEIVDIDEAIRLAEGRHERQSISARKFAYNRFRTSFFWSTSFSQLLPAGQVLAEAFNKFLIAGPRARHVLSDSWERKIVDLYAEGNATLSATFGLPLEKYGYPLA